MIGFTAGLIVALMIVLPTVWFLQPGSAGAFAIGVAVGLVCTSIGMALDA